jgi:WD40 repeat protein
MKVFVQHFEKLDADRQKVAQSERLVNTFRAGGQFHVADVVWCGDNNTIVSSGGTDTSVLLWGVQQGEMLRTLDRAAGSRAIACGGNGRFVASGNSNKEPENDVRVWDASNAWAASNIAGPFPPLDGRSNSFVRFLIFNQDSTRLYAHFMNRKGEHHLVLYEVPSWKVISDFALAGRLDTKPTLSPKGQLYAYGLASRDIAVVDALNGVEKIRFRSEELLPSVLAFGHDDKTIFVGGQRLYNGPHQGMPEQVVEEHSLPDGKLLRSIKTGHIEKLSAINLSPDSAFLITASGDKTVELRNAESGALITTQGDKANQIYSVDIRPDGRQFASASGGAVNIWVLK